jgi:tetratricopeptide (TPR) repeat protein
MKTKRHTTMYCENRHQTRAGRCSIALLLGSVLAAAAGAEPYVPAADDEIVETLPPLASNTVRRSHSSENSSTDFPNALADAANHVSMARTSGDPRYLGYAQAALNRWWTAPSPPPAIALLRAQIHQHNHDFRAALVDLDYAAARDPRNAQVHLTRAAIYQVQGDYDAAQGECRRLALLAAPLTTAECLSRIASYRGHARAAYDRLFALRERSRNADRDTLREVDLTLADIAVRLGDVRAAERHYRSALDAGADSYVLAAWADFLLSQRRFDAVIELQRHYVDHPDLLLRAAIAARATHSADADVLVERLRSRYAAHQRRGDFTPSRDYARFLLEIEHNPPAALDAALINWRTQREPSDAQIVLDAAIANDRIHAAAPVIALVRRNRLEDVRLEKLISIGERTGSSSMASTAELAL